MFFLATICCASKTQFAAFLLCILVKYHISSLDLSVTTTQVLLKQNRGRLVLLWFSFRSEKLHTGEDSVRRKQPAALGASTSQEAAMLQHFSSTQMKHEPATKLRIKLKQLTNKFVS